VSIASRSTGGFTTYYFGNFNRTGKVSQNTTVGSPIPDDERFWYMSNGFEDPSTTSTSSSQSEYTTVSYLARALYSYRNTYFLNASFRNDASSRIPEKKPQSEILGYWRSMGYFQREFHCKVNIFSIS
jgi:hypothetical protein